MQAITTHYHGPTETKPSCVVAKAQAGSLRVSWNYDLGVEQCPHGPGPQGKGGGVVMADRFEFTLADGRVIAGAVQGNGGLVRGSYAMWRLLNCQRFAAEGLPLPIYEPNPGCVKVMPGYCAFEDGEAVSVPLVGTAFRQLAPGETDAMGAALNAAYLKAHPETRSYAQV